MNPTGPPLHALTFPGSIAVTRGRYAAWPSDRGWDMRSLRLAISTGLLLLASGCGTEPAPVIVEAGAAGTTAPAPAASLPAATDEAGLRSAASRALSEQRLYAPAGDNAVEHYLALRAITTGDTAVETALLELLPYAQIAIEQATARGEWGEARRLIGLVETTDAGFPALARLRDRLVAAEADAAREAAAAVIAEAEAREAERQRLAAEERERSTAPAPAVAQAPAMPAANARTTPPASATPSATTAAPARAVAQAPARAAVPVPVPALLEAPQPRYPLMALRRKLEGEVVLELRIEANGSVGQARVLSATPPGLFDEAAVAAAERWRFATGQAAVTTRQVMRFRLPAQGRSP